MKTPVRAPITMLEFASQSPTPPTHPPNGGLYCENHISQFAEDLQCFGCLRTNKQTVRGRWRSAFTFASSLSDLLVSSP